METTKEKHATHTPGPWQIEDCTPGESTGLRFEVGTKDSVIARTTDGLKEAHANARLIAAAPEMYEMCKLLEECMENIDGRDGWDASYELAKVREVLAKVEGGEE
jgi:hypothetical protein